MLYFKFKVKQFKYDIKQKLKIHIKFIIPEIYRLLLQKFWFLYFLMLLSVKLKKIKKISNKWLKLDN